MKANEAPEKIYCESDGNGNIVIAHNIKWPDDEAENIEYTRTNAFKEVDLKKEPASEDFESEWKRYCDSKGGGAVTMNIKDVAKHFAHWQKEQMLKDAIDATIDIVYAPTTWVPYIVYDRDKLKDLCKDKFEQDDRIKVIIIKE